MQPSSGLGWRRGPARRSGARLLRRLRDHRRPAGPPGRACAGRGDGGRRLRGERARPAWLPRPRPRGRRAAGGARHGAGRLVPAAALQPGRRLRRGHALARGDARRPRRGLRGREQPVVLLSDGFCEPDRLRYAGAIDAHPETWLGERRRRLLFDNAHRAAERAASADSRPRSTRTPAPTSRRPARSTRCSSRWTRACSASASTRATRPSAAATRWRSCARPASSSTTSTSRTSTSICWPVCTPRARGSRKPGRRACSASSAPAARRSTSASQHLLAIGYDRWIVVEQDRILAPGEPFDDVLESAERNRAWLRARGL